VSPDVIDVDGTAFKRDDIHRVIIKSDDWGSNAPVVGATPVLTETSGSNISNIVQRKKNAAVCHSLDLETGGNAYICLPEAWMQ